MGSSGCRASECLAGLGLKPGLRVPCTTGHKGDCISQICPFFPFLLGTDRRWFLSWQLQEYLPRLLHFHCLPSWILATERPEWSWIRMLLLGALRRSVASLVADVEIFPTACCPPRPSGRGPPTSPGLHSLIHSYHVCHRFSGAPVGSCLTCSISLSGTVFAPLHKELAPLSSMSPCKCPLREALLADSSEKATCFLYHSSLLFPWWFLSWFIIFFLFVCFLKTILLQSFYVLLNSGWYKIRMLWL